MRLRANPATCGEADARFAPAASRAAQVAALAAVPALMAEALRVIIVEPDAAKRDVLAGRLRMQGYAVDATSSAAEAARLALAWPPRAVIADLWMPSISGVQLCRLLRSEPATEHVPVILRAPDDASRNRFWAERAGAAGYVAKGRMGDLVRTLSRTIAGAREPDDFFIQIDPETVDVRDRVSELLDTALFDSVLAAEVRALGSCESFPRLFDLFSQFLSQVTTYRWMAIRTDDGRFALHTNPDMRAADEAAARAALGAVEADGLVLVEDDDAVGNDTGPPAIVRDITFGSQSIGRIAMAAVVAGDRDPALLDIVGRELGGPIRMTCLVQEAQRLANYDPLTGILNRRAFMNQLEARTRDAGRLGESLGLFLFDVDHFKAINDHHGHAIGDRVLRALGVLLEETRGPEDAVARWGGEEFVMLLPASAARDGRALGEALRVAVERMVVETDAGERVPVNASIGFARWNVGEPLDTFLDRADKAMYAAKVGGRNRLVAA